MNLLIALFLIVFEASYEGFKLRKWHITSEIIEFIYLIFITFVIFGWYNGYFVEMPTNPDFWFVLVGYILFRYAIFDFIFNLASGNSLFYIGNTKLFDKLLGKLSEKTAGWFVVISKLIAFGIGLSWICGWRYGILN